MREALSAARLVFAGMGNLAPDWSPGDEGQRRAVLT